MIKQFVIGTVLLCVIRWSQADVEIVMLEDTNGDHDKRNLDMGLPETLEFNLKRGTGSDTRLQLQENKRLNPNAPVYTTVTENGMHKAVKVNSKPLVAKYYTDKNTNAAVQVSCETQYEGPCYRVVEGTVHIDGHGYEIRPSSAFSSRRSLDQNPHVPHEIKRFVPPKHQATPESNESDNIVHGPFGSSYVRVPDEKKRSDGESEQGTDENSLYNDYLIPPDTPPWERSYAKEADKEEFGRLQDELHERGSNSFAGFPPLPKVVKGHAHLKRGSDEEKKTYGESEQGTDEESFYNDYLIPPDTPPWERSYVNEADKEEFERLQDALHERGTNSFAGFPPLPKVLKGHAHLKRDSDEEKRSDNESEQGTDEDSFYNDYLIPPEHDRDARSFSDFPPRPHVDTGRIHLKRALEADKEDPYHFDYLLPPDTELGDYGVNQNKGNESEVIKKTRPKRQTGKTYTVEMLIVIDPYMWKKQFASTTASNGMTRDEATMYSLRQRMAIVMNGVSLRYANIDDPDLTIHLTISGYVFYQVVDSSNPLPTSVSLPLINWKKSADSAQYLNHITFWHMKTIGLPTNDHIMVITGLELFSGSTSSYGIAGSAYLDAVCSFYRVSVQEEMDLYLMALLIAHELGHNLGAPHDGSMGSAGCSSNAKFIMAPFLTTFNSNTPYTRNPWKFSTCAVNVLKTELASTTCLENDNVLVYDKAEFDTFNAQAPGIVFSPDDQCKMNEGENSFSCTSETDERICLTMGCYYKGSCYAFVAARGTPCGVKSLGKWCIEGQCVVKLDMTTTTTQAPTTTTTTTTQAPTTTTTTTTQALTTTKSLETTQKQLVQSCVNTGWKRWSCGRISKYFKIIYDFLPSYWCLDAYWNQACCALCAANAKLNEGGTTTTEPPTTTKECVNKGYYSWSCTTVSAYFKKRYGLLPRRWCLDPDWSEKCCQLCANEGA